MSNRRSTIIGRKKVSTGKNEIFDRIKIIFDSIEKNDEKESNKIFTSIDFNSVNTLAKSFARHIESNFEELADILLEYESFEVVKDEIDRTLDTLKNLHENKDFFILRIGQVTSFLPRNQPLYALTCFVIIPSLLASEVHFRIPHTMKHFFPRLIHALKLHEFFPNISVSHKERLEFLKERSALLINSKTDDTLPITDAVVFTGTSNHAERLRLVFDKRTLFIANGSGHNPVVVSEDADIQKAVEATLTLQLYNQGQDCAAPNAILVHKHAIKPFLRLLREEVKKVKVGQYRDRSCRVGPISDPTDLKRIQTLLVENREWIDPSTPGIIHTTEAIVQPTIICKPLKNGGNFEEVFSPLIIVQEYAEDNELSDYFENPLYARNAMYISVFGTSHYIKNLIGKKIEGKVLHDKGSILWDIHLHAKGVERGVKPYGGNGYAASSFSINGKVISQPTLPQREIYEQLVEPLLIAGKIKELSEQIASLNEIHTKDVQKLLGLKTSIVENSKKSDLLEGNYIDVLDFSNITDHRYYQIKSEQLFSLLKKPNIEYFSNMQPKHIDQIRTLYKFLKNKELLSKEQLEIFIYSLAKKENYTESANRSEQLTFFKNVYQLLMGKDKGPRLAQFLIDIDREHVLYLLNI